MLQLNKTGNEVNANYERGGGLKQKSLFSNTKRETETGGRRPGDERIG